MVNNSSRKGHKRLSLSILGEKKNNIDYHEEFEHAKSKMVDGDSVL